MIKFKCWRVGKCNESGCIRLANNASPRVNIDGQQVPERESEVVDIEGRVHKILTHVSNAG